MQMHVCILHFLVVCGVKSLFAMHIVLYSMNVLVASVRVLIRASRTGITGAITSDKKIWRCLSVREEWTHFSHWKVRHELLKEPSYLPSMDGSHKLNLLIAFDIVESFFVPFPRKLFARIFRA